jgi:predicted nucleic acid-binding protein
MAIATAAGMLSSMLLTLLVVPVFYLVFDDLAERLRARLRRRPQGPPAPVIRDPRLGAAAHAAQRSETR